MTEITNVVLIPAQAGKSDALYAALLEMVEPTLAEPGCSAYVLHRSTSDSDHWMVYESWKDQAALDFHLATQYVQQFISRIGELVDGPIDIKGYKRIAT
jgi:quinol monooxygenase YgiN